MEFSEEPSNEIFLEINKDHNSAKLVYNNVIMRDLESLAEFDIRYSMDTRSGQEFAMIGTLTVRLSLLEEIVCAHG